MKKTISGVTRTGNDPFRQKAEKDIFLSIIENSTEALELWEQVWSNAMKVFLTKSDEYKKICQAGNRLMDVIFVLKELIELSHLDNRGEWESIKTHACEHFTGRHIRFD